MAVMYRSTGYLNVQRSIVNPRACWMYVSCSNDIGKLYRYLTMKFLGSSVDNLMSPKWGSHITFVRREYIIRESSMFWQDRLVEFEYDNENIQTNGKHYWLPVRCDYLKDIRERLFLPRKPKGALHMTFGVMPGTDN